MSKKNNDISTIGKGFKSMNADVNAARKKKSHKVIAIATIVIVVINVFMVWWWPRNSEFGSSGIFNEKEVKKQAEKVAELVAKDDYDGLSAMADKSMQKILVEENRTQWEALKNSIGEDWGEFVSFGETKMGELKQMGKHYATIQIQVTYKNVKVTYSLSFDEEMRLAGMYLK